jgi:hypothetical protein
MARGGYRPGAGRPRGSKTVTAEDKAADAPQEAANVDLLPLDYMLKVLRDPAADPVRRDRMAIAAAPFLHPRKEPVGQGKKEAADEKAKKAAGGKFAPMRPPLKAVP